MSERMKRSVLLCIVAFATMSFSYAQPKAAGGIFSFCGIGLTYEHDLNQNCFIEADLRAETSELFLNRTDYPGVSASLTSNFILKEYSSQNGNPIRIFAGSGITAGKARDLRKDSGYFNTTPFFISYLDDAKTMREAYYDRLINFADNVINGTTELL